MLTALDHLKSTSMGQGAHPQAVINASPAQRDFHDHRPPSLPQCALPRALIFASVELTMVLHYFILLFCLPPEGGAPCLPQRALHPVHRKRPMRL